MPTDSVGDSLWQACVDQLAQELPEQQFNTWIKPLTAQVADDLSRVTVFVANRFKLDWVRAQYAGRSPSWLEKLYGQPVHHRVSACSSGNRGQACPDDRSSRRPTCPVTMAGPGR